jgi:EAL domain-containing protein (putative c-di-GMP-specific phosphodiesterase class I)
VTTVLTVLEQTGARPNRIKLELTESSMQTDLEATIAKMHKLCAHQITFSLDDFGTGYSSLARLHLLPLDSIKIDRSFVMDIDSNPKRV